MGMKKERDDRSPEERLAARKMFEVAMRQAAMEYDATDDDQNRELDFREFSRLIREREMGVHSEIALRERFNEVDADGSGMVELDEYISFALRDAFVRSAANLSDLFTEWDTDGDGHIDKEEFRGVVRQFGFKANDELIDSVFSSLDIDQSGELDLRDLSVRLAEEVRLSGRKLQRLRGLEWRESAYMEMDKSGIPDLEGLRPEQVRQEIWNALKTQNVRVMDIFRMWDTNGDGLISREEFRDALTELGFDVNFRVALPGGRTEPMREQIDAVFAQMDKDGSGELEYDELNKAIGDPPPVQIMDLKDVTTHQLSAADAAAAARQKAVDIVKAVRSSVDLDLMIQLTTGLCAHWARVTELVYGDKPEGIEEGDHHAAARGVMISRMELRELPGALGISLSQPQRAADALFVAMDTERDGRVSFDDLVTAVRASLSQRASEHFRAVADATPRLPPLGPEGDTMAFSSLASLSPRASPRNCVGSPPGQRTIRKAPPVPPIQLRRRAPPPAPAEAAPVTRPSVLLPIRRLPLRPPGASPRPSPREMEKAWFDDHLLRLTPRTAAAVGGGPTRQP